MRINAVLSSAILLLSKTKMFKVLVLTFIVNKCLIIKCCIAFCIVLLLLEMYSFSGLDTCSFSISCANVGANSPVK